MWVSEIIYIIRMNPETEQAIVECLNRHLYTDVFTLVVKMPVEVYKVYFHMFSPTNRLYLSIKCSLSK